MRFLSAVFAAVSFILLPLHSADAQRIVDEPAVPEWMEGYENLFPTHVCSIGGEISVFYERRLIYKEDKSGDDLRKENALLGGYESLLLQTGEQNHLLSVIIYMNDEGGSGMLFVRIPSQGKWYEWKIPDDVTLDELRDGGSKYQSMTKHLEHAFNAIHTDSYSQYLDCENWQKIER